MSIIKFLNITSNYGNFISKKYNKIYRNKYIYKNKYFKTTIKDREKVDLITIAFNNDMVIKYQFMLLNKYFKDDYYYTVCDNSSNIEISEKIKNFCEENKIPYCKLYPQKANLKKLVILKRILKGMYSESHAIALNFIFENYIKQRNCEFFGLLDHDIFPIENFSVKPILDKQNFYGVLMKKTKIKYLWPGFCFYKTSFLNGKKVNFMTNWRLDGDTGSSNYKLIKNVINNSNIKIARLHRVNTKINDNDVQGTMYSMIDKEWLHMINAGNWKKSNNYSSKEQLVFELLNKKLK